MRKLLLFPVALMLIVGLALPAAVLAQDANEMPAQVTVLRPSADLLGGGPASAMGKPSTPPGLDKKPKPDPEPEANKWAVVIGIADYAGVDSDLWHPDEDAKEMRTALINNYGFPKGNVKTLTNRKATANAILDAIDWLAAREDAESTVVFFFSGHGYQAPDIDGWDSDLESDGYDEMIVTYDLYGLPDGMLRDKFSAFESQKFALIFGSCHSGGMFDDPDVDLQAAGRVICSACKAEQYGWDYLSLGNTLFGYYFVDQGILQGLADVNGDGVSMEEALAYAYPGVIAQQADSQPQIYDGFAGELVP
jgi:uncharacterized caspase-like protein